MNIYVGNLSGDVGNDDLRKAFETFGQVTSATVIKDKFSGESRGFGFVEMPSRDEAKSAIESLNGTDLKGQSLTVNEARPRNERSAREEPVPTTSRTRRMSRPGRRGMHHPCVVRILRRRPLGPRLGY